MLSLFSQFIFGNSSLFSHQNSNSSPGWRDKNLCFDLRTSDLELEHGEQLIACFFPIEDVKGNPDELGVMKLTNLRLIWICCDKKRTNLSLGWRTVSLVFEQNLKNSFGSSVTSLCVLSKLESTKYEFVFNKMPAYDYIWNGQVDIDMALDNEHARRFLEGYLKGDKTLTTGYLTPMYLIDPFEVVFNLWDAYKRTNLFRHCRANFKDLISSSYLEQVRNKGPIVAEEINRLPGEEILELYGDIIQSQLKSGKHTGKLILTNVRLIWVDDLSLLRNFSIPYIRIESIRTKQTTSYKLLVTTHDYFGLSNQIKFWNIESSDWLHKRAKSVFEHVQNLYSLYKSKPKYGPESCEECIEVMQHLRPAENYMDSPNGKASLENFGPIKSSGSGTATTTRDKLVVAGGLQGAKLVMNLSNEADLPASGEQLAPKGEHDGQDELTDYCTKLNSYLDEQPIEHDQEVIYSKELGLAIERPMNDLKLERIWRIDLT